MDTIREDEAKELLLSYIYKNYSALEVLDKVKDFSSRLTEEDKMRYYDGNDMFLQAYVHLVTSGKISGPTTFITDDEEWDTAKELKEDG